MPITALLFIGLEGSGPIEQWVFQARMAAAYDAMRQLSTLANLDRIVIVAPPTIPTLELSAWPVFWDFDPPDHPFHFGKRLAEVIEHYPASIYLYLGAGSWPLLPTATLMQAVVEVERAKTSLAITNNPLSSDWMVFNCPDVICIRPERLARDNMLGPVLKFEAGVEVRGLPASAATRVDIDTPTDLTLLALHPHTGPALQTYLRHHPQDTQRWQAAGKTLFTPGSRITLIGRVASAVGQHLETHTHVWTRVFSEERGMAASGRQSAGQVRSWVGMHLARVGANVFFEELTQMTDAVFFDTRVLMAHFGRWPSAADRYASDLGLTDLIADVWLREFTEAAVSARIPVVLGGHGVVAGNLYGAVEIWGQNAKR